MVIEGYGTLTIAPGVTLALEGTVEADWEQNISGGLLECGALMVLQGTFSAGTGAHANLYGTITVENGGSLIVNGGAFFGGDSFTVKAGGHVTNNGWISFGEDSAITVEDGWAAVWTQGEGAEANKNVAARLEQGDNADQKIQKALADINASTLPDFFSYTVPVYREDSGERIELTQDLTIPAGVELGFYNEGVTTYIAEGAALTIQGGLYSNAPITVDGKLTVSANGYANVQKNLLVGGTLTIDEGGRMYCQYLTDENEQGKAGTIVNNGSLSAEQTELKHNEVDIGGGDDGSKVVRSLEALKSALAEGGQINYSGTELTISEDLTIPENVNLTIDVTTFTVNEGVTLTNKGNVWLYGDAYLYGKLDVSNESGYIWGYGLVKAGGEDNLGDEYGNRQFNWTARISKEGASETLTQEELTAAGASVLADGIEINLGSQTTLTLAGGLEIRDKNVSIGGANAAKVVVNGTLSVWNYLNLDAPVTVNGTVNVYDSVYASRDITVNTGGRLHVRNYYNESEHRQWTGSVQFGNNAWIALPEGAAWDDYVTVDDGCNLCVNKSVRMSELESFLKSCNDGRKYMVTLRVDPHQGESIPVYFATGTTVVIPENVELRINNLTYRGYSAFVIGAAILIYLIFTNSSNLLFSNRNDVTLISFIGMTEDEFRASEYNSLLKLQKEEEYSDEPAGTIVKQNPKAGRTVKEGQKITLTVSLGTQYITIPETKNMVAEDAEQTLKDMGLRVTKKPMVDATVAPGAVIYTQPAAGETVTGDSMVIVYVSRQDKDKTQPVPSLTGRMLEDARNEIKGKFSVRVVEQASEQPAGTVLSQSPAAGSEARITSAITLVVSTGVPEVVETPTDTGNGDEGDSTIEESWWPSADGTHQIHQLTDGSMWNENGQRCDAQGNPL